MSTQYFNSNLVRLKAANHTTLARALYLFQFQSGTIKGLRVLTFNAEITTFQFQSGTIKGGLACQDTIEQMIFQFQSGTIKGWQGKET